MSITIRNKEIKKFGFILVGFLLIYSIITYFKGHHNRAYIVGGVDAVILLLNLFYLDAIKPIYKIAMKFAHVLGIINTKIILSLVYYLLFTPIALFFKLIRKELLAVKVEKNIDSYWIEREIKEYNKERYERQF